jgi:hypothetical protein
MHQERQEIQKKIVGRINPDMHRRVLPNFTKISGMNSSIILSSHVLSYEHKWFKELHTMRTNASS